jgi:hypothetical protein
VLADEGLDAVQHRLSVPYGNAGAADHFSSSAIAASSSRRRTS